MVSRSFSDLLGSSQGVSHSSPSLLGRPQSWFPGLWGSLQRVSHWFPAFWGPRIHRQQARPPGSRAGRPRRRVSCIYPIYPCISFCIYFVIHVKLCEIIQNRMKPHKIRSWQRSSHPHCAPPRSRTPRWMPPNMMKRKTKKGKLWKQIFEKLHRPHQSWN